MIEIIALVLLCIHNAKISKKKGYNSTGYVFMTIGMWIGFEIAGALIGVMIAGNRMGVVYFLALAGAVVGGVLSNQIVKKLEPKNRDEQTLDASMFR